MKAFPNEFESAGMDLRDYFAAKAMQGLVTSDKAIKNAITGEVLELNWTQYSISAYQLADAMMEARKK